MIYVYKAVRVAIGLLILWFIFYMFEKPVERLYKKYQRQQTVKNVYPAYAESAKALNACIASFNTQFFLAPVWKKYVPEGKVATVDVYKWHASPQGNAQYVFVIPEMIASSSIDFWIDSDVPHFKVWAYEKNPSMRDVHFRKDQHPYRGRWRTHNSVVCNPVASVAGTIESGEMYYIVIKGSFTAQNAMAYDKGTLPFRESYISNVRGKPVGSGYSIEKLHERGDVFEESLLTPDSKGMVKVHSFKL